MSAQVEFVSALCGLCVGAAAVVLPALPAVGRRVKAMQADKERREAEARRVVETSSASRSEQELSAAVHGSPNYTRSGEYPVVALVAGDEAQVWQTQERLPQHAADEPVDVVLVTPAPPVWMRPALEDEQTPVFDATGPAPAWERLETFTQGWARAPREELIADISQGEYELAKGDQAA